MGHYQAIGRFDKEHFDFVKFEVAHDPDVSEQESGLFCRDYRYRHSEASGAVALSPSSRGRDARASD